MKSFRSILLLVSMTGLLGAATGCGSIIYDNYPLEEEPELVTLVVNVGMVAPTRAAADSEREAMHSLRIVLLNDDEGEDHGKVEYNTLVRFNTSQTEYGEGTSGFQFIRTKPGDKKIFLVANEESVTHVKMVGAGTDFDGGSLTEVLGSRTANAETDPGDFEALVNAVSFAPGGYEGMNIPLSSSYAFNIAEKDAGARVTKTFYLVHAATKFEFEFVNNRTADIRIDELSLSRIAEDMFLMAHFDNVGENEDKTVEWTEGGTVRNEYWIDWLKEVSDATNSKPADPDNEQVNAAYGWITDYGMPAQTTYASRSIVSDSAPSHVIPVSSAAAGPYALPTVYCPESKYIPASGRQEYRFSVTLTDTGIAEGPYRTKQFTETLSYVSADGGTQDNLVTLFRNTHVRVRCTLGYIGEEIDLHLHVIPWSPDEPEQWDFVDHATVQQRLTWTPDTFDTVNEENGDVVLLLEEGKRLEGKFTITAPVNGRWYARLTPIGDAKTGAVSFVDKDGNVLEPNAGDPATCLELSDQIDGTQVTFYIQPTIFGNDQESRFRLDFYVENLGQWMTVPMALNRDGYYTIVRKANILEL